MQVAGDLDLALCAPHLESLSLAYGQATCREPAQLPMLRSLQQETPTLRALHLRSCACLSRLELGLHCEVAPHRSAYHVTLMLPHAEIFSDDKLARLASPG